MDEGRHGCMSTVKFVIERDGNKNIPKIKAWHNLLKY